MRWKRGRWQLALAMGIGLLFSIPSPVGLVDGFTKARPARVGHQRRSSTSDPPAGPVIVRGTARREKPLMTPFGTTDTAAWIGHVGRLEGTGKSRYFHVYCTLSDLDDLEVELVAGQPRVRLASWDDGGLVAKRTVPVDDGKATIDFFSVMKDGRVPDDVARRCGSIPADAEYFESTLQVGETVEVSGCHEAGIIRPCRDAADIVTGRRVSDTLDDAKSTATLSAVFSALFGGMGMLVIALIAAAARPLLDRKERETA